MIGYARSLLCCSLATLTAMSTAVRAREPSFTVQHYDQARMPDGRSVVTGNTTQFYDQHNNPAGRAVQTGNTIQYYDVHNIPTTREIVQH